MRVLSGKHGFGKALLLRRGYPGYGIIVLLIHWNRRKSRQKTESKRSRMAVSIVVKVIIPER
jgi:hypothetical protein